MKSDLTGLIGSLAFLAALYLIIISVLCSLVWLAVTSPLFWPLKALAVLTCTLAIIGICGIGLSTLQMIVEEYSEKMKH